MLSILSGHRRYAHVTGIRCDGVNPALLGMGKVISEDALRSALKHIAQSGGSSGGQTPLEVWRRSKSRVLDIDTTIKPLYGRQQARYRATTQKAGAPLTRLSPTT
ncbi:MAG: hypothetical protein U1F55_07755 [Chitinivorax sp.]